MSKISKLKVVELFAGVGGFRIALDNVGFETVWANQWEPGKKNQFAADCYLSHFPEQKNNPHFNADISLVTALLSSKPDTIPNHDLLVGGFPCQDYSVATTQAKGMLGKKGVLWWEIEKIIKAKSPSYVLLENVDRLLVSPSKQRGRDMAILLSCLRDLEYVVEWRVINAADYGFAQKRRRVFIFAAHKRTCFNKEVQKSGLQEKWLQQDGFYAQAFPVKEMSQVERINFDMSTQEISDKHSKKFENSGIMVGNKILTAKVKPAISKKSPLSTILVNNAPQNYYVNPTDITRPKGWQYVKGAKKEQRTAKNGHSYFYTEGAIPFPEKLDEPARTILTSEGNKNPNRSTHLIEDPVTKKFRTLTPIEVERLNGFPDDWTQGMSERQRYFCMGNALVIGVIERLGRRLQDYL
jgi:DNA (cytosine-5)-methyltransferase 1